jgi:hypothetical protein
MQKLVIRKRVFAGKNIGLGFYEFIGCFNKIRKYLFVGLKNDRILCILCIKR